MRILVERVHADGLLTNCYLFEHGPVKWPSSDPTQIVDAARTAPNQNLVIWATDLHKDAGVPPYPHGALEIIADDGTPAAEILAAIQRGAVPVGLVGAHASGAVVVSADRGDIAPTAWPKALLALLEEARRFVDSSFRSRPTAEESK